MTPSVEQSVNTEAPFFSVVIPTYNRRSRLELALQSVWEQTVCDYEVIVVDDGSSDGTWDYLSELKNRVSAIRQENEGPAAARNAGVACARGQYIVFLDSDDILAPFALEILAGVIRDQAGVAAILAATTVGPFAQEVASYKIFADPCEAYAYGYRWGTCTCFRRTVFAGTKGFDPMLRIFEDQELILRFPANCGAVVVEAPCLCRYLTGNDSLTRDLGLTQKALGVFLARARLVSAHRHDSRIAAAASQTARGIAMALARKGDAKSALSLWFQELPSSVRFKRWRFILALPVIALVRLLGFEIGNTIKAYGKGV